MAWNQFLDKKRYLSMYEKVMAWDNSAGEEAFNNAKSRFLAKINHRPCDLLYPDPDANIDVIDWDSPVDEDLYREVELERQRKFLVVEEPDPEAALEELKRRFLLTREELLLEMKVEPTGWGDEADAKPSQSDDWENKAVRVDNQANEWGPAYDNRGVSSRFPSWFQGNRRHRRRGKIANGAAQIYPPSQWRKKPLAQG